MHPLAQMMFDKPIFDEYFSSVVEPAESFKSSCFVNQIKVDHLNHILSINKMQWDLLNTKTHTKRFKESDVHWLLFYAFANHCNSLPSTNRKAKVVVKW